MKMDQLFDAACKAAEASYSPYSHFRVGAALLCEDGSVICGANVENRSYGLTICAERCAVFTAVSGGYRRFVALAIATPDSESPVGPCGACRQVLTEFMAPDAPVRFGNSGEQWVDTDLRTLLPYDSLHNLAEQH